MHGKALFQNKRGAGIHISDYSTVVFNKNSDVAFIQNSLGGNYKKGVITLKHYSSALFDKNSRVTFNNHGYFDETIYSSNNSHVTFTGNLKVAFYKNGYMLSEKNGTISFKGNSTAMFRNTGCIELYHSCISFEDNSTTIFSNTAAIWYCRGGVIYSYKSSISFKGNSTTLFSNNDNFYGGVIHSLGHGYISLKTIPLQYLVKMLLSIMVDL